MPSRRLVVEGMGDSLPLGTPHRYGKREISDRYVVNRPSCEKKESRKGNRRKDKLRERGSCLKGKP